MASRRPTLSELGFFYHTTSFEVPTISGRMDINVARQKKNGWVRFGFVGFVARQNTVGAPGGDHGVSVACFYAINSDVPCREGGIFSRTC